MLTTCPTCQSQVSTHARACPRCGEPFQTTASNPLLLGATFLTGLLFSYVGYRGYEWIEDMTRPGEGTQVEPGLLWFGNLLCLVVLLIGWLPFLSYFRRR